MLSKKAKLKKLEEVLVRHKKGVLPKGYYSRGGHLYAKSIMSKDSPESCAKRDRDKDLIAAEKAKDRFAHAPIPQKEKVQVSASDLNKIIQQKKNENSRLLNSRGERIGKIPPKSIRKIRKFV